MMRLLSICLSSAAIICCVFAADGMASFGVEMNDASEVTWAHAVNSLQALQEELKKDTKFLEADVSMGHLTSNAFGPAIPVMAHPPDVLSDASLDNWLDIVIASGQGKGVKLDFKSLDAVKPSLELLKRLEKNITFPLFLNADIVAGPVNSQEGPVPSDQLMKLLKLGREQFPNATLSLGWTTNWHATLPPDTWHYEWHHIRSMVDAIFCRARGADSSSGANGDHITFPVRAIFAARSLEQLQWLLGAVPGSTLTVWSGRSDPLDVQDLIRIRSSFPKSSVYYDVPEPVDTSFRSLKSTATDYIPPAQTFANKNWMTVSRGDGESSCASYTYVSGNAIAFGKQLRTAVMLKSPFALSEDQRLEAHGYVTFSDLKSSDQTQTKQELVLVLADVSLFSKNDTTSRSMDAAYDDSDLMWSAINSSRLHVFRHDVGDGPSCHMFRLDTASDTAFQAWDLPCDVMYEGNSFQDDEKVGKPTISSRRRLVLPAGPAIFGFMSSGESHVVVHNLRVSGESSKPVAAGSASNDGKTMNLLLMVFCSLMWVLVFV